MAAGRHSRLNDPEFAKQVADLYISGMTRDEMAVELDCHKDSITNWVKDPRVQAHAKRAAIERVNRITRRTDGEIEARLAHAREMATKELIMVRREYLERPLKILGEEGHDQAQTTNEIAEAMDSDPDLAQKLQELLYGSKA